MTTFERDSWYANSCRFIPIQPSDIIQPQSTEFGSLRPATTSCHFVDYDEEDGGEGKFELVIEAVVKRHFIVHLFRIVAVMFLYCTMSLLVFTMDRDIYLGDRLAVNIALMLTGSVYSVVVSESTLEDGTFWVCLTSMLCPSGLHSVNLTTQLK